MSKEPESCLFCHRCGAELTPGEGNFYIVRIEAFADPTPPRLDGDDSPLLMTAVEIDEEINNLIEQMKNMTERELMDQVYVRMAIHLCGRCYRQWIENPAG